MSDAALAPLKSALLAFLAKDRSSDAVRVFHGRGGCYPGLQWCVVDAFAPVLLVTLFDAPPEAFVAQLRNGLEPCLRQGQGGGFNRLLVQHRYQEGAPYEWLIGEPLEHSLAWRGASKFHIRFTQQNVGFFLDMEPGREWLEARCAGKSVLNLFSYTCAFSVVACAAGAKAVVNVDMSRGALTVGRENHRLNSQSTDSIQFLPLDILKSWSRIRKPGPYDVIIIDPPSFQKGSFVAKRDYAKLIRRIPQLAEPGADILACLNAPELTPDFLLEQFHEHCPGCRFEERLPMPLEFCDISPDRQLKLMHFSFQPSSEIET